MTMNHEERLLLADLLAQTGREDLSPEEFFAQFTHPISAEPPQTADETPDEAFDDDSRPQEEPCPNKDADLAWHVEQLRMELHQESRRLTALLEDQKRKDADSAARNRREGRRCRSYGFIAGTALVMAAMPLLTAAMTLSWKAMGWFAQTLEISPAAFCAGLFCTLLGVGTLKATKPLGDRITEWLEEDYDEEEV